MSDEVWIKLIDQLAPIVTAVGAVFIAIGTIASMYFNYRVKMKLDAVEQSVNGHTEKLIEVEKAMSREEGIKAGVKQERADEKSRQEES